MTAHGGAAGGNGYTSLGLGSPDERIRRVEQQVADAQRRAVKAQEFKANMESLRAVGASRNGGAEVEVDSAGVVVDLALTDKLDRATLAEIRAEILEAIDDARRRAGELAEEYVTDAFGDATGLAELFRPRFATDDGDGDDDGAPRRRGGIIR